jgi:hypothetical protein
MLLGFREGETKRLAILARTSPSPPRKVGKQKPVYQPKGIPFK